MNYNLDELEIKLIKNILSSMENEKEINELLEKKNMLVYMKC